MEPINHLLTLKFSVHHLLYVGAMLAGFGIAPFKYPNFSLAAIHISII